MASNRVQCFHMTLKAVGLAAMARVAERGSNPVAFHRMQTRSGCVPATPVDEYYCRDFIPVKRTSTAGYVNQRQVRYMGMGYMVSLRH